MSKTPNDEISNNHSEPMVFGFGVRDSVAAPLVWSAAQQGEIEHDWIWLHLDAKHEATKQWLAGQASIPPAATRALLAPETRPHVTTFGHGLVVNLRGVNHNEGDDPEDMVSIRIWLESRRLITTRLRRVKAAQDLCAELTAGRKIASTAALTAQIAARLTDRMEPFVQSVEDKIDSLEEAILQGEERELRSKLASARQVAVVVRRFIAPQREAVSRLASDEVSLFGAAEKIEFREVADRVTRLTEDIDAARERAMVLQDQLTDRRAEEMNRNMMILSIAAAIFLPLGFLTGLFGINVGGMPGVESPIAFWVVVVACLVTGVGLGLLFKYLKWL
ncbi:MAG: zinc transporter ZntB [Pseudomonadota bacterium]